MIETVDNLLTGAAMVLLLLTMVPLAISAWRMIVGPGYANRFIALDMLTGVAVAVAALTAVATARREFLDIAFGVALIGFIATCAFAALLERKGDDQ
ncbi:cation transporter [Aliihoeflea aestuarii]|jgi:multicomponent Na+:H+ antiporter subunit F|uniref:monovalent cation/H+ antiporter complex subunit F n=1 Tax=Aliihoeflea aestuarii TaxID=453840 RepID=UPI00209392F4|nr:monovalent cation/H+ antiporter complex subunit F [Aliihoeflea aestuarii]MCO6390155.1 cation transporter [Aliihoeflea aestuarii]